MRGDMNSKGHGDFSGILYLIAGFIAFIIALVVSLTYGITRLVTKGKLTTPETIWFLVSTGITVLIVVDYLLR